MKVVRDLGLERKQITAFDYSNIILALAYIGETFMNSF